MWDQVPPCAPLCVLEMFAVREAAFCPGVLTFQISVLWRPCGELGVGRGARSSVAVTALQER